MVVALVVLGVGIEEGGETAANGGAVLAKVVANAHTLDLEAVELGNDAGNVPAGEAIVLLAAHVKLTPGGGVLAKVGGGDLAGGGSPATLRVVIDGDVLDLTLSQAEGKSLVGGPEASHLVVGAVGVPEDDVPGLGLTALETEDVLVLAHDALLNLNDVATPWDTDVADVVPVEDTDGLGLGDTTEAGTGVLAVGGEIGPGATGARGGSVSRDGGLNGAGDRGHNGDSGGGGNLNDGGGGGRSGREQTGPLVDPGLEDTIDGGSHDITDSALVNLDIGLDIDLGVGVTTLMAVQTGDGRASGQRRGQEEGVLDEHFFGGCESKGSK